MLWYVHIYAVYTAYTAYIVYICDIYCRFLHMLCILHVFRVQSDAFVRYWCVQSMCGVQVGPQRVPREPPEANIMVLSR